MCTSAHITNTVILLPEKDGSEIPQNAKMKVTTVQAHGILRVIQFHLLQLLWMISVDFAEFYWLECISRLLKDYART